MDLKKYYDMEWQDKVIYLRQEEKLTLSAIAERLGRSLSTVKCVVNRYNKQVKQNNTPKT